MILFKTDVVLWYRSWVETTIRLSPYKSDALLTMAYDQPINNPINWSVSERPKINGFSFLFSDDDDDDDDCKKIGD